MEIPVAPLVVEAHQLGIYPLKSLPLRFESHWALKK